MIRFEGVSKVYSDGFRALDHIDLEIKEGELLVLIGPSGSGKTTLMKMINRLIEPTEGRVLINGKDVSKQDPVKLRRNIGYVIQHIGLMPHMTIEENVALVPRLKKWEKKKYQERVHELLEMVNLDPETYGHRYPAELSGGQQQRIGVIRALAADPPIVLMDEPFSALDPISREQLQDELLRLQEKLHKTIVFVTHDIDEAIKIADRICLLNHGRIVQLDTPERLLRHPANDFVRAFIGEDRLNHFGQLPGLGEVMIKPVTSRPNRGLAEAVSIMRKNQVDTLMVVDKEEKFLGVVRVWDIHQYYQDEAMTLEDVMKQDFPTVKNTETLNEAIRLISLHGIACLPVVDEKGILVGAITRASLVNVMAKHFGNEPKRAEGSTACGQAL